MIKFGGTIIAETLDENNIVTNRVISDNMVVDNGLNLLMDTNNFHLNEVCVSADASQVYPQSNDIGAIIATTTRITANATGVDLVGGFYWRRVTWEFDAGAATGNITKVGVRPHSSLGFLSIIRLVDTNNVSTVISPQSNERLKLTYTFRSYYDTNIYTFNNVDFGKHGTRNLTIRQSLISDARFASRLGYRLHAFADLNSPEYVSNSCYATDGRRSPDPNSAAEGKWMAGTVGFNPTAYVSGTFYKTFRLIFGINNAVTSNGIKCFVLHTTYGTFVAELDVALPKPPGSTDTVIVEFDVAIGRK